ncbi:MAG: hypothetical protein M3Z37_06270 [Candidatus Eremiobacteraeota bacterium]|nr:hypothetical protein [Candidatus Eremiobacteraeota bacterium]
MARVGLAALVVLACASPRVAAAEGDGYDSPLAQAVRTATQRYRLVVWARLDGYVQSTDYISAFGTSYTNHDRFDPPDLGEPTLLLYDAAGRLVACGYQFRATSTVLPQLGGHEIEGWYEIPRHVHYNIVVNHVRYYEQRLWDSADPPTAAALIEKKLMPPDAVLNFAFVHPATKAIIIWAWQPNPNGLFDTDNPTLP